MKPYANYKDSGVPWIGEIPQKWGINQVKYVSSFINGYAFKSDELKAEGIYPVIKIADITNRTITSEFSSYSDLDFSIIKAYQVREDDIVIAMSGATVGKLGLIDRSSEKAYINQRVGIIRSKTPKYLLYSLENPYFLEYVFLNADGSAQPNISSTDINNFHIVYPPLETQQKITTYLDKQTTTIDTLITDKEKLLTLLAEERQAIISEAVTKGLDPHAEMKDSGVEWIGEIPVGWEVVRVKNILKTSLMYGANESAELDDTSLPRYIRITDIDEKGNLKPNTFRSLTSEQAEPYLLEKGDILLARSGASVGKSYHHESNLVSCFAGYLIKLQVNQDKILSKFVYLHTLTGGYKDWIVSSTIQATIQNVSAEKYNSFVVTLPPLEVQEQIVQYLDEKTSKIDQIVADTKEQIKLLKEYRQSLISEVVTGKVEV